MSRVKRSIVSFLFLSAISAFAQNPTYQFVVHPGSGMVVQYTENGQIHSVAVTGELIYPTPWVLNNLQLGGWITQVQQEQWELESQRRNIVHADAPYEKLDETDINELNHIPMEGQNVLSVGEGASGFIPFVERHRFERGTQELILGLDLWYAKEHMPEVDIFERQYFSRYQSLLIKGDAGQLSAHFKTPTFDLIVANYVFTYLPTYTKVEFVRQALNLLKSKGTLRFNTARALENPNAFSAFLNEAIPTDQRSAYKVALVRSTSKVRLKNDASVGAYELASRTFETLTGSELILRFLNENNESDRFVNMLNTRFYEVRSGYEQFTVIIQKK